jgi:hypothetical protein
MSSQGISIPQEIKDNNRGIFEVRGDTREILKYLQDDLDLKEFKDFAFITNQTIEDVTVELKRFRKSVKMIHFLSMKGFVRFIQSGPQRMVVNKWMIPNLKKVNYSLWEKPKVYEDDDRAWYDHTHDER